MKNRFIDKELELARASNQKIVVNNRIRNISGCDDAVYSYDVFISSELKYHGALTFAFCTQVVNQFNTIQDFINQVTLDVYSINKMTLQTPSYSFSGVNNSFTPFVK